MQFNDESCGQLYNIIQVIKKSKKLRLVPSPGSKRGENYNEESCAEGQVYTVCDHVRNNIPQPVNYIYPSPPSEGFDPSPGGGGEGEEGGAGGRWQRKLNIVYSSV